MSDYLDRISRLSPTKLAILAAQLQERVETMERGKREPIAIIGMGCRFPGGANSPEGLWRLLRDGVDAISEVPPDRWDCGPIFDPDPDAPGKVNTRWGGFLAGVDRFDAKFFGIAPREAVSLDPQQRLLLEVAWEALENAGVDPHTLDGSRTGVFVGICNADYAHLLFARRREAIDAYSASGSSHAVAAGRLSYLLGLQGPSIAVDTACSSSLVAVDLACSSLREGQSRLCLVAGVNLILAPSTTIALTKAHMMASDGRCKTFAAGADGFVRGEGCGVVVLKRLSHALADGDTVQAVIRGTATNQDGRSSGLTAPNGPAQEAVIRAALADAGVQPHEVSYVEAHGTGTALGDPIEVRALAAALGADRSADRPLAVGSIKTNIGHLESAAGVAGLIKVVLALRHGEFPPHLHLRERNPYIEWSSLPIVIPTERTPWPDLGARRLAGVSSFGFSGTNAHLIVEEPPPPPAVTEEHGRPVHIVALSAKTEAALKSLAERYGEALGHTTASLADIAYTANSGRAHFEHRAAVVAESADEASAALGKLVAGTAAAGLSTGRAPDAGPPEIVFLFTGQGSQYVHMGRRLYETSPRFRETLGRCHELLLPHLERPLLDVLYPADGQGSPIDDTVYTQPALFAVEYSLAELWRSWGVEPSEVMGHSVGEYVAACVAGILPLEEGLRLIAERARLIGSLPRHGAMAAVFAAESRVLPYLKEGSGTLTVAAVNGPESVVLSGTRAALDQVLLRLSADGISHHRLTVSHAFHSPLMDPILDSFERRAGEVEFGPPRLGVVSNLTGELVEDLTMSRAEYWRRHLRQPVRFEAGVETLERLGRRVFVEVGPTPTLLALAQRCGGRHPALFLPSLRRGADDWRQMLDSLGRLYTAGARVDWKGFDADCRRRRVSLPTYPFERERHWIDEAEPHGVEAAVKKASPRLERIDAPVLIYQAELAVDSPAVVGEHRLRAGAFVPASVFLVAAIAAARPPEAVSVTVRGFSLCEALPVPDGESRLLQCVVEPDAGGETACRFYSRVAAGEVGSGWRFHGSARVSAAGPNQEPTDLAAIRSRCRERVEGAEHYARLEEAGLRVTGSLRCLQTIERADWEVLARIESDCGATILAGDLSSSPILLDGCLQSLGAAAGLQGSANVYVVAGVDRATFRDVPGRSFWVHARLTPDAARPGSIAAEVRVIDEAGRPVAELCGVRLRAVTAEALFSRVGEPPSDWFYEVRWRPRESAGVPLAATATEDLRRSVGKLFPALAERHGMWAHEGGDAALAALAVTFAARALRRLGCEFRVGDPVGPERAGRRAGVIPRHDRLFGRLFELLKDDGCLAREGTGYVVVRAPPDGDPGALRADLLRRFPGCAPQVELLCRCGSRLAEVLRGECDPVGLLFADGSFAELEDLYERSPFALVYNGLLREAIAEVVRRMPADRPLRVLEVGAGTGGSTSFVLPALPPERTEYVFSDLSPLFLQRAREKFASYPFVRYEILDIERDPGTERPPRTFDVLVAANVLHATADLRQTLRNVRQLLVPGGVVFLLEGTRPEPWVDLTFGMTEGWWRFTDAALRPSHPLVSRAQWTALLSESGFESPVTLPEGRDTQQVLVMARASESTQGRVEDAGTRRAWVIVTDEGGVGQALARLVEARGERCALVGDPGGLSEARLGEPGTPCEIVFLCALDADGSERRDAAPDAAGEVVASRALRLLQSAIRGSDGARLRSWLVTRGAQPTDRDEAAPALAQSPVWGLGRVFALEHPDRWGGLIDLDPAATVEQDASAVLQEILCTDGEDQIVYRDSRRHVPRLVRAEPAPGRAAAPWDEGSYLITGGAGGLGLKVGQWLAAKGARDVILLGRAPLPERKDWPSLEGSDSRVQAIRRMEEYGTRVWPACGDVAERRQLAELFGRFGTEFPPLKGVVHAAARFGSSTIERMAEADLREILRPKVVGAWLLHEMTKSLALDFFVLFSSTTSLWGSGGMGHYAGANQFLDALAHYRHRLGLPALAVNWGTWDEMRLASETDRSSYLQAGLRPMPSESALTALSSLLRSGRCQATVADVDWAALVPLFESRRRRPFFDEVRNPVAPTTNSVAQGGAEAAASLEERLRALPAPQRQPVLREAVQREVFHVLGLSASEPIPPTRGLFEMGMDSLMSVELKKRLEVLCGHGLPSTLTFNHPSVEALANYLATAVFEFNAAQPGEERKSAPDVSLDDLSEDELECLLAERLETLGR